MDMKHMQVVPLPEDLRQKSAEKLNGRTAMVGFFFAIFSYALTGNLFFGLV